MWLRLRQVALVTSGLAPVLDDLAAVFGLEVAFRDPGVGSFGLENAVLPVGHQFIEVVAPTREGTAGGRYLERRHGDGGYMVITHTDDHEAVRLRVGDLGVRTVLEFDHDDYQCLQLHPADTGGSFLEIDRQEGGEDPAGPWEPAGPNWQAAVRTDVVDGIAGVQIQAADPSRVAARWSAITGIALTGGDRPALELDNATLRFVPPADDRGDGLAAIELRAVDAEAAHAAADQRGLTNPDGIITICGMRFVLVPDKSTD
jgi:hypothetical protein